VTGQPEKAAGAVTYWHVDDVLASVDPARVMHNKHYLEMLQSRPRA